MKKDSKMFLEEKEENLYLCTLHLLLYIIIIHDTHPPLPAKFPIMTMWGLTQYPILCQSQLFLARNSSYVCTYKNNSDIQMEIFFCKIPEIIATTKLKTFRKFFVEFFFWLEKYKYTKYLIRIKETNYIFSVRLQFLWFMILLIPECQKRKQFIKQVVSFLFPNCQDSTSLFRYKK